MRLKIVDKRTRINKLNEFLPRLSYLEKTSLISSISCRITSSGESPGDVDRELLDAFIQLDDNHQVSILRTLVRSLQNR